MKMTREQTRKMKEVERLVALERRLTDEERLFVFEHYQEGESQNNAAVGAFFTPWRLARDFAIEVPERCNTIVDLCAGIGSLAYWCEDRARQTVCVEQCAEYVRVGRKLIPDATWIHANVFGDWLNDFDGFDVAIGNPPFGNRVKAEGFAGRYTGSTFEYKVIELASRIADVGVFIVPQSSAPFVYSGSRRYDLRESDDCRRFMEQTGILLEPNCGIDTAIYREQWHGVAPTCEVVLCDFEEFEQGSTLARTRAESIAVPATQLDLFAAGA